MDVYLSASPPGSSHFPLGDGWSQGPAFPLPPKVVWQSDRCTYAQERICSWRFEFWLASVYKWRRSNPNLYIICDPKLNTSECQEAARLRKADTGTLGCCKVDLQDISVSTFCVIDGQSRQVFQLTCQGLNFQQKPQVLAADSKTELERTVIHRKLQSLQYQKWLHVCWLQIKGKKTHPLVFVLCFFGVDL